jgi:large subunit ribosomal protein L20
MPRVKRGVGHVKKRKTLLSKTKGYQWGRKNLIRAAKTAVLKAGVNAYSGRKNKKRDFRGLFQIRISAFAKENGLSYSRLMGLLKVNSIELDRKVLADMAINNKEVLLKIIEEVRK